MTFGRNSSRTYWPADYQRAPGLGRDSVTTWVTTSNDEGATWSAPADITAMTKKPEWTRDRPRAGRGHPDPLRSAGDSLLPADGDHDGLAELRHLQRRSRQDVAAQRQRGGPRRQRVASGGIGRRHAVVEHAERPAGQGLPRRRHQQRRRQDLVRTVRHSRLPEPCCQGSILRYTWADQQGGKSRILFCNPGTTQGRDTGTVRLSYDEAKTWPVAKVLEQGLFRLLLSHGHAGRHDRLSVRKRPTEPRSRSHAFRWSG